MVACSPDPELTQKDSNYFPAKDQPVAMRLSYELEAMTHREVLEPGKSSSLTFLDEIASEPVASRQAISIVAFADGSTDYLIEKRSPERILLPDPFEGVPPNDTPPVVRTKITSGTAYFYDAQDNLLYQHPMEEDYAMYDQMLRLTGQYDWEADAQAEGATVERLNETTLKIIRPVPNEGIAEGPAQRTTSGRYTEEVVVPDLNLLLGSSLYEADGTLVSRMVNKYNYEEDKDEYIPELMYYEEYGTNETIGSQYVSYTTYYYDDYSLQIN